MTHDGSQRLGEADEWVRQADVCAPSLVRRIAAMLDIDAAPLLAAGILPCGWHFPMLSGETRRSGLRNDGFPGFGVSMPELGLPRLLLLGRTVEFRQDVPVGAPIERRSLVEKLQPKETAAGPAAIVTLRHELAVTPSAGSAIVETQSYMLLGPAKRSAAAAAVHALPPQAMTKVVTPDATMLFQYSALGFNSHKIHLDRAHARDVEGLPDLVVNGGLITLLLTEFLRVEHGLRPRRIRMKHVAPLFCGRPVTLAAMREADAVRLLALDDAGALATEMEAEVA